jgi:hypothetical protein
MFVNYIIRSNLTIRKKKKIPLYIGHIFYYFLSFLSCKNSNCQSWITSLFVIYLFVDLTGIRTKGLTLARQVLYYLSHSASPDYIFKLLVRLFTMADHLSH